MIWISIYSTLLIVSLSLSVLFCNRPTTSDNSSISDTQPKQGRTYRYGKTLTISKLAYIWAFKLFYGLWHHFINTDTQSVCRSIHSSDRYVLFTSHAYIHTHIQMWVGIVHLFTLFVLAVNTRLTDMFVQRLHSHKSCIMHTPTHKYLINILTFPSLFCYIKFICLTSLSWIFFCLRCSYSLRC